MVKKFRSAVTGAYVSEEFARANPGTTVAITEREIHPLTVLPFAWVKPPGMDTEYARTFAGVYAVWGAEGGPAYMRIPNEAGGTIVGNTREEAKAAAERHLESQIKAAILHTGLPPAIPEGWRMVPVQPVVTPNMMAVAMTFGLTPETFVRLYGQILEASPAYIEG